MVNSGVADQVGIILEYIRQVPRQTLTGLPEYEVEELLHALPIIKSGLEKIGQGIHPSSPLMTDDEFRLATGPTSTFHDLAEAIGEIAFTQPMSPLESRFIRTNIQQPLSELAKLPVGHPVVAPLISVWAEKLSIRRGANEPFIDPGTGPG